MFKETWKNYSWIEKVMVLSPLIFFILWAIWKLIFSFFIFVDIPCSKVINNSVDRVYLGSLFYEFDSVKKEEILDLDKESNFLVTEVRIGNQIYTEKDYHKNIWGFHLKSTPVVLVYHDKKENLCQSGSCKEPHGEKGKYCENHTCTVGGCEKEKKSPGIYCSSHGCLFCDYRELAISGADSCRKHTCQEIGCHVWAPRGGYCSKHQEMHDNAKKANSSSSSSYTKKSGSKKKYIEWPDPDDYDSFEDFMDDWDGNMPYDMDAEDYWDNW